MQVRFAGHLNDHNFLEKLPPTEAEQFRERVKALPSYMTVELSEQYEKRRWTLKAMLHVDEETHQKYGTIADVPALRGETVFYSLKNAVLDVFKNIFRQGPLRVSQQVLKVRRDMMSHVMLNAENIQNNINKVRDLTRSY